jgi:hypothetical protein
MQVDHEESVTEGIRARSSGFVNDHADIWVAAEEDGVLALGSGDPVLLFDAAADWLREDPELRVVDVRWEQQAAEPANVLRLRLGRRATH